jgi:hypothetical protein
MADKIHFQPVLVSDASKLSTVEIKDGQYIIVTDTNEVYVDMNNVRKRTSTKAFVQSTAPTNPIEGDIWLVTEEE